MNGAALHRWLGLGATQRSGTAATRRRVSRAEEGYSRARPDHGIPGTRHRPHLRPPPPPLLGPPDLGPSLTVDLSESLLAFQSDLGPYWGRGVSRKRDRPMLVDLCLDEESSEDELEESLVPAPTGRHGIRLVL